MQRKMIFRSLAAGCLLLAFATLIGCSSDTTDNSSSKTKQPAIEQPAAVVKMPSAEFQQPPTLPPTDPLPKPSEESPTLSQAPLPDDPPIPAKVEPQIGRASGEATEQEQGAVRPSADSSRPSSNPLRDAEEPKANPPAEKKSEDSKPIESLELPKSDTPAKTDNTPKLEKPSHPEDSASTDDGPAINKPEKGAESSQKLFSRPQTAKNSGKPFDPIKVNGKIFEDWPKPKVALVITGMEEGYLEPCGCAGLDRMKGGMSRRHTFFQELRKKGWPVVGLDVGGLVRGFGRQAELKFQTTVEGKRKMAYDAITFGADDLRLPAGELVAVAADVNGKPSPFVTANVGLFGFDAQITPKSRIIEAGKMKIGVTAVLGKSYQKEIHNDEIEMADPESALKKIVPELKKSSDYRVLLAHAKMDEAIALAKKFPEFNVVIVSDGQPEPPAMPEKIPGTKTLLITVGYKGMNAIVLGLFDDAEEPFRYQRVPLDSRFAASPDMKLLMTAYQQQLQTIGFEGLGLRALPHPLAETNGQYIGTEKCASCHEKSYDVWKKSGHARAFDTLSKLDPPRDFDPECVSCHVTGWHPTKYFPYASGFVSKKKTPHLVNVGCEDCHGPGEKHAAAELGSNKQLQEQCRKTIIVTKAEAKKQQCYSCHDLDNSPDFDFDKYWPFVEHKEKE